MRLRAVLPACLAAATLLSLTAFPAQADPTPTAFSNTVTDPVGGTYDLHVTTDAPAVLLVARDGGATATQYVSSGPVVPVGTDASWSWPTWGFAGPVTVQAFDCSAVATCPDPATDVPADSLDLTVDNTVADFGAPTDDTTVYPDAPTLDVTVPAAAAGGDLSLLWGTTSTAVTATDAPTTIDFSNVTAADSTHALTLTRCNHDNAQICATDGTSAKQVRVLRSITTALTLGGTLTGPHQTASKATETVTFDPAITTGGTWTLTNADDTAVDGATPKALDVTASPAHFTVDPAALGLSTLPDGDYKVVVTTTGDRNLAGTDTKAVTWDATAPVLDKVTASLTTVYPYPDGYRDTISAKVAAPANGGGGVGTLQVLNANNTVVRSFTNKNLVNGTTVAWNGAFASGTRVAAGNYRFRTVVRDAAGNTDTDLSPFFAVSAKRLVTKHLKTVVTAQKSLAADGSGRCSSLRKPGLKLGAGSVGYYSEYKCTGKATDDSQIAVGVHVVKVPGAYSYGTLGVRAYGRAAKAGSQALAMMATKSGDIGARRWLTSGLGWHSMGTYKAATYIDAGHEVVWAITEGDGARYDIGKFEVTLDYKVLQ